MSTQNNTVEIVNPNGKWIFRIGGIASLVIGVVYIVIIAMYAFVGVTPVGGEARLEYLIEYSGESVHFGAEYSVN